MNNQFRIILFLLIVLSVSASAQLAMGKWRTHFAYNSVSQIAQSESKIYAVSDGALFSYDKIDKLPEYYSKVNGLNGSSISRIEYDKVYKQLLIVYVNGNIDVITSGGVSNIPDLFNKQMSASKEVNQIKFYENKAYLSTNFGIVVVNLQKKEIADTYFIGPNASEVKVLNTTVHNGIIYALTTNTLFKASINEPHLVNYEFWSTSSQLPGSGDLVSISTFSNKLILLRGGKLYRQEGDNSWKEFSEINAAFQNITITSFNVTEGSMNVYAPDMLFLVDKQFSVKSVSGIGTLSDAEFDVENNLYWFAANNLGVISYKQEGTETPVISYYKPDGPAVNRPWSMTFSGKKLFVVPGGRWANQYNIPAAVMIYENGAWRNIVQKDISEITGYPALDFMNVAVNPSDNKHFFVTSYGTGVYEFKDDVFFKWHNHLNSTLETAVPADALKYIRTDGAIYDKQGNLWLNNIGEIKVLLADGTWTQLSYDATRKPTLGRTMILSQNTNHKWIPSIRYTPGISIFDDNGTITDQSDDRSKFYSSFIYPETDTNGQTTLVAVNPGTVYTLAQDKNGVVWAGTDQGPFLFHNPLKVFDNDFLCARVKIPREDGSGLADYLLQNERIKAIAIDGANRKWIGTESSGVYLLSENGQKTIEHFTVSNSPLLSNDILTIEINPVTGEVFFGTGLGIVSYQSDASEAENSFGDVYAYPNPVRQGYTGVITITGLVANTQVKITDLNGNLVCQTVSNGSIATWDGKDTYGRKVSTGVYLAICANADGTKSTITKILVIN